MRRAGIPWAAAAALLAVASAAALLACSSGHQPAAAVPVLTLQRLQQLNGTPSTESMRKMDMARRRVDGAVYLPVIGTPGLDYLAGG
jgi:hypothetical protein